MTKFVLHGGFVRDMDPNNDSFFHEITAGTTGRVLILLNYFARDDEEVEKSFKQHKERFLQNSGNQELVFEIAKPDTFVAQLKKADVLFISGGDTKKLVDKMSLTPNLRVLFHDKVVAGSSAGVYVLSKYYWSNDKKELGNGLGILNFKALCHHKSGDTDIVNKLLSYKEDLPLLTLPDHKWIVVYE